ncbi:hypothetical protein [Arenibacterium halophilum]|uniref:Uncharacterized protein n=1 Tax=Arenibacterium halophilum TaxID=2583821 RepID=A0ABY2XCF3_9RHOB|nr:hypothetical protein [Arenibacterium halophilum]TMV14704.1 hypothetical protein FGK64_01600 [Arenibacterium halophilum]
MSRTGNPDDPKGLIREAYNIEGITEAECRSIFLDWALSLGEGTETAASLRRLVDSYGANAPDHPMTAILRDGQTAITAPRRRGGWRSRPRS